MKQYSALTAIVAVCLLPAVSQAGVVFANNGLAGGSRWDAAPRTIGGLERSLDGGLRYSVQGASYDAFRDQFSWAGATPSSAAFQSAVESAFGAWTSVDPVTGLTTGLSFVSDFGTTVNGTLAGNVRLGSEIDLFAQNLGDSGTRGFTFLNWVGGTVTLTSGTAGYSAGAISGADVTLNSNAGAVYTLDLFRRLLTHEVGHAIGFADVEGDINPNSFIDDNFDGSSSASALLTLTNSWAGKVNPLDPSASVGLSVFNVPGADPGVGTLGVDILMESRGLGIGPNNLLTELVPLSNDDFGIRQFLYPSLVAVPEPTASTFACIVGGLFALRRRPRRVG